MSITLLQAGKHPDIDPTTFKDLQDNQHWNFNICKLMCKKQDVNAEKYCFDDKKNIGHSMLEYIIAPAVILLLALFVFIGMILFYWIKINCCQGNSDTSCDDLSMRHETGPPPSYSGLSLHLPPSYSQACRIIGYRRSCDDVSGVQTNPAFSCEADRTGSVSSLSLNNVINFSNSHSDVVAYN